MEHLAETMTDFLLRRKYITEEQTEWCHYMLIKNITRCVTYMDGRCCLAERVLLKHATFDAYSSRSNSAKS